MRGLCTPYGYACFMDAGWRGNVEPSHVLIVVIVELVFLKNRNVLGGYRSKPTRVDIIHRPTGDAF
jgi:hypothetical protein